MKESAPVLPSTLVLLSGFEVRKLLLTRLLTTTRSTRYLFQVPPTWPPTELSFTHSPYSKGG